MKPSSKIYQNYLQILKEELVPAMGCTEPIAIAYASAKGRDVLGAIPDSVLVEASGNIIKNVKSVVVPNTNGHKGIEAAAAAGIVAGISENILEVIANVTAEEREGIAKYLKTANFKVTHLESPFALDIRITLKKGMDVVIIQITKYHTNIVYLEKNGEVLFDIGVVTSKDDLITDRSMLSVEHIIKFADCVKLSDVEPIITRQIEYNSAISKEGLTGDYGANIGKVLRRVYGDDVKIRAKAAAAAASDARMSGCELPVVIVSGSGNQGLTTSLPVIEYAKEIGASKEELIRALVVANLCTIHQKTSIGRLSAFCGAVSAGTASGAGIAYLLGGRYEEIAHTIVNSLAIVSGMVCDGAKPSCAAKIASSVDSGILGYYMFKEGQQFYSGDGLVTKGVENTIRNIGRLGKEGMKETDREIIRIMAGGTS